MGAGEKGVEGRVGSLRLATPRAHAASASTGGNGRRARAHAQHITGVAARCLGPRHERRQLGLGLGSLSARQLLLLLLRHHARRLVVLSSRGRRLERRPGRRRGERRTLRKHQIRLQTTQSATQLPSTDTPGRTAEDRDVRLGVWVREREKEREGEKGDRAGRGGAGREWASLPKYRTGDALRDRPFAAVDPGGLSRLPDFFELPSFSGL